MRFPLLTPMIGRLFPIICVLAAPAFDRVVGQDGTCLSALPSATRAHFVGPRVDARGDIELASHSIEWDSYTPESITPVDTASYDVDCEDPADGRPPTGWTVGYDGGFVIASPGGLSLHTGDSAFLMKIGSWGQFRYAASDFHGPNPDFNRLDWERLRLVFRGHAYSTDLRYFIHIDADSDEGHALDLLDYRVTYDVGHDALGLDCDRLAIRLGRWKMPFARFREEAVWRLQFTDFAMADWFFDVGRPIGVGLLGSWDCGTVPLAWEVALINGFRTGRFDASSSRQLDRNFGVCGRFTSVLAGDFGNDGEPDLMFRRCPAWKVGAGFAFSRVDRIYGQREFEVARVVDSGERLSAILPAGATAYDIGLFTVDSHVKYHGVNVIFDYFFRTLRRFSGAPVADLFDHGFLCQAGIFVVPEHLELLARWSRVVGDSGTLGAAAESADEVAGGIAWYIRGHNLKLVFDATHLNGAPISSKTMDISPGDAGWLFRSQFQMKF